MSTLGFQEIWYRDHQPWLLSCGYQLRPRFQPDWIPSWVTNPPAHNGEKRSREDFLRRGVAPIMDAIRLSDGKQVMLKKIYSKESGVDSELLVAQFVSSPEQMEDPDNHCVPIYEVLKVPDDDNNVVIVMPLLRKFQDPRFDTVGEGVDFLYQVFKGLQYLHRNRIAHRDCTGYNVMMDGSELYPEGFHPVMHDRNLEFTGSAIQRHTRTQRPPKYYWIDFGLSIKFDESDKHPRALPMQGGDKSVPEHQEANFRPNELQDPFPTDIYYLGNLIRTFFTEGIDNMHDHSKRLGFEFLEPLVRVMVQDDPSKRPTIDQCVIHLEELIRTRTSCALRAQVWHISDNPVGFIYRFFPHWARRITFIITQTPAVPSWRNK